MEREFVDTNWKKLQKESFCKLNWILHQFFIHIFLFSENDAELV